MELIFVLAIITVLSTIFLPVALDKLRRADEAAVDASIQGIAAAMFSFYSDLRGFPSCHATNCSSFPGTNNQIVFLAFGLGSGSLVSEYPDAATGAGNWDFAQNDESTPARNNAANHLLVNDPVANGTPNESTDYRTTGRAAWKGPYVARLGPDPWGRAIIAYVGAMESSGKKVSGASGTHYGWILSAGPNNSLDTLPTSSSLQGDDRGVIVSFQP